MSVNEIIVQPEEVRCTGNILEDRTPEEWGSYQSKITDVTDDMYGECFCIDYNQINIDFRMCQIKSNKQYYIGWYNQEITYGDSFNFLEFELTSQGVPLTGKSCDLFLNSVKVSTATSDSNGYVRFTDINVTVAPGKFTVQLKFNGDSEYGVTYSDLLSGTVVQKVTTTSMSVNKTTLNSGESLTITGQVSNWSNVPDGIDHVTIYDENGQLGETADLNSEGEFSITITLPQSGTYQIIAAYIGDYAHAGSNSDAVTVTYGIVSKLIIQLSDGNRRYNQGDVVNKSSPFTGTFRLLRENLPITQELQLVDLNTKKVLTEGYYTLNPAYIQYTFSEGQYAVIAKSENIQSEDAIYLNIT